MTRNPVDNELPWNNDRGFRFQKMAWRMIESLNSLTISFLVCIKLDRTACLSNKQCILIRGNYAPVALYIFFSWETVYSLSIIIVPSLSAMHPMTQGSRHPHGLWQGGLGVQRDLDDEKPRPRKTNSSTYFYVFIIITWLHLFFLTSLHYTTQKRLHNNILTYHTIT